MIIFLLPMPPLTPFLLTPIKKCRNPPTQSIAMDKSEDKNVINNVLKCWSKTHLRKCSGLLSSDEDLINTTLTNSHNIATPASILIIVLVFLFMRIRAITATREAEFYDALLVGLCSNGQLYHVAYCHIIYGRQSDLLLTRFS